MTSPDKESTDERHVDSTPAGGAALGQVIGASAVAMLATAALLYLGWAHRTGRNDLLRRIAGFAARDTGLAPWAALPSCSPAGSLLVALLGMYWDISLHIDNGRDPGPLANPAHYLILVGLFGIFAAGFLAIVLPEGKPSPRAIRIAGDWYAPLGGIAMLAAAGFALIGFPLDDIWHRIFGQDVTLWGPTHLMLIGGAGLTLIGTAILSVEGQATIQGGARWPDLGGPSMPYARVPRVVRDRRPADRALDLPGRVRLRRAPVPTRARADHARVRVRRCAGSRPGLDRPRRRDRRGALLHRRPRRARRDRRRDLRRDGAPLPALPGRGRVRRARGAGDQHPPRLRIRRPGGRPHRHRGLLRPSTRGRTSGCRSRGRRGWWPRRSCRC